MAARGIAAVICELPHIGRRKNMRTPIGKLKRRRGDANARMGGGNRRRGIVIGLIWSVAAMSDLVPVVLAE
jgi:hypothetical protein